MSQSGSESDIWDYKPLKKTKKRSCNPVTLKRHEAKKRKKSNHETPVQASHAETNNGVELGVTNTSDVSSVKQGVNHADTPQENQHPDGVCPVCQMPFSLLVVQSQAWHVGECLDTPGGNSEECPDGLQCASIIPNHYRRYNHTLLAQTRASNSPMVQAISDSSLKSVNDAPCMSAPANSLDCAKIVSASSRRILSGGISSETNALLLLRSPNSDDMKKKKGWSPSIKRSQSQNLSQEARLNKLSPVKVQCVDSAVQTHPNSVKKELFPCNDDDDISYSPLSDFPVVDEQHWLQKTNNERVLQCTSLKEDKPDLVDGLDDTLKLFSDDEEEEQFFYLMANVEVKNEELSGDHLLDTCGKQPHLLAPDCKLGTSTSTGVSHQPGGNPSTFNSVASNSQIQSPQSLVLERLREHIATPAHVKNLTSVYGQLNSTQEVPLTQASQSLTQKTQSMPPKKTKAGPSGLKQTDIGVFFGLQPLSEQKAVEEVKGNQESSRAGVSESHAGIAKRQSRSRLKTKAPSDGSSAADDSYARPTQTGGRRGGRAEKQKRWNRGRATDGGPEEPRHFPFYKKIPGTGFAVDAFQYGAVNGVTAYFLTHFHSDHYGGLKKGSVYPIYCNKVTGNLVISKLKVAEQYVHILPMNTECVVHGVKVTLLDANHCPGAAMLLFVLPDGQTVLHTGDFRADRSMERYPELEHHRIQTLYLDTTYCSPEYTFPTQHEVITFAVNIAFEKVTLNPRTLVVCGTYAVGKEKVFLAISEALGSKVCLSTDKFNTMHCLESEEIKQRITKDWQSAQVHVLPMMQINFKNLRTHLDRFSRKYDQLVAFKPTGWTFNQSVNVEEIQPETRGNISIYGIPYSEHSSYLEMKRFVQWLRPDKIIPTVNVGSWKSRKAMEGFFHEWLTA